MPCGTPRGEPSACDRVSGTVNDYFATYEPDAHGVPLADVIVREATPVDLVACGALVARREGWDAEAVTQRLRNVAAESGQLVMVAERGGDIVGYAKAGYLTPVADGGRDAPDGWYLSGIVVAPEYRRRGIGRALTQARCEWVWEREDAVHYVVASGNRASLELHESLGFREVTRDFVLPGVVFGSGTGLLCRAEAPRRRLLRFPLWRASARGGR